MKTTTDNWFWAIQYMDTLRSEREADEAVLALSQLDGFLAGRSIAPSPSKPGWRVQAFFEDSSSTLDFTYVPHSEESLPDNMKRVVVRPSMLESFITKR